MSFQPGDFVKINEGNWKGAAGKLVRQAKNGNWLITITNRAQRASAPASALELDPNPLHTDRREQHG